MTDILSSLDKIQQEEVDFKSALSENTMTKIGSSINGIIDGNEPLGTVVTSILTVAQFTAIKPASKWVRMQGQSIVGSELNVLTGITTLPDTISTGRFLRQTDSEANLLNVESNQNKAHDHDLQFNDHLYEFSGGSRDWGSSTQYEAVAQDTANPIGESNLVSDNWISQNKDFSRIDSEGGIEARPESLKVNYFIKINN